MCVGPAEADNPLPTPGGLMYLDKLAQSRKEKEESTERKRKLFLPRMEQYFPKVEQNCREQKGTWRWREVDSSWSPYILIIPSTPPWLPSPLWGNFHGIPTNFSSDILILSFYFLSWFSISFPQLPKCREETPYTRTYSNTLAPKMFEYDTKNRVRTYRINH